MCTGPCEGATQRLLLMKDGQYLAALKKQLLTPPQESVQASVGASERHVPPLDTLHELAVRVTSSFAVEEEVPFAMMLATLMEYQTLFRIEFAGAFMPRQGEDGTKDLRVTYSAHVQESPPESLYSNLRSAMNPNARGMFSFAEPLTGVSCLA